METDPPPPFVIQSFKKHSRTSNRQCFLRHITLTLNSVGRFFSFFWKIFEAMKNAIACYREIHWEKRVLPVQISLYLYFNMLIKSSLYLKYSQRNIKACLLLYIQIIYDLTSVFKNVHLHLIIFNKISFGIFIWDSFLGGNHNWKHWVYSK